MLKLKYALVCDDFRREDNGKLIYIGVYGNDVRLAKFPATLSLWLVGSAEITEITGDVPLAVQLKLDGKVVATQSGTMGTKRLGISNFGIPGLKFTAEKPCKLEYQWKLGESDWEDIFSIAVVPHE